MANVNRIEQSRIVDPKLIEKCKTQPALFSFNRACRVMRNKVTHQPRKPHISKKPGTIDRMKTDHWVGISDIMQSSRCHYICAQMWR